MDSLRMLLRQDRFSASRALVGSLSSPWPGEEAEQSPVAWTGTGSWRDQLVSQSPDSSSAHFPFLFFFFCLVVHCSALLCSALLCPFCSIRSSRVAAGAGGCCALWLSRTASLLALTAHAQLHFSLTAHAQLLSPLPFAATMKRKRGSLSAAPLPPSVALAAASLARLLETRLFFHDCACAVTNFLVFRHCSASCQRRRQKK